MKVLKWVGYVAGALVILVSLAAASVAVISWHKLARTSDVAVAPISVPSDEAAVARGRHLADAVTKCVHCHGANLGGSMFIDDAAFARLPAPNITRGRGGRGAAYSDAELARLIRHGIKRDGRPAVIMPSSSYQYLSDADLGAIIAYVRSMPNVDRAWPAPKFGPVFRSLVTFGVFPAFPADHIDHSRSSAMNVAEDTTAAYGRYLASVGGCRECHNPSMSGGKVVAGDPKSPPAMNLTPGGTLGWTEEDFLSVFRTGQRVGDHKPIDNNFMPWRESGRMTPAELHAIWLYLKSLPSKELGQL